MQWYWIAAFVAAFIALVVLTVYLTKNGKITQEVLQKISGVALGMNTVTEALAKTDANPVFTIANMVTSFVSKAVLAAENACYNNEISKEDRRGYCMNRLGELLQAYNVELNEEQWRVVDTLIAASCEEMGHTNKVVEG